MKIEQMKYKIFPLCEKSIVLNFKGNFGEEGSLEQAVFKILPMELAEVCSHDIEKLKLYVSPEVNK